MRQPPKPPAKITDIGLKKHLDLTASKHNDMSYHIFLKCLEAGLNPSGIARLFNVTRITVRNWIKIHKAETESDA